jgi:CBS domain-containing protein
MEVAEVVHLMETLRMRRVPVVSDDARTLVGMITEADAARHMSPAELSELVAAIAQP